MKLRRTGKMLIEGFVKPIELKIKEAPLRPARRGYEG